MYSFMIDNRYTPNTELSNAPNIQLLLPTTTTQPSEGLDTELALD